jgi:hypothetical protein
MRKIFIVLLAAMCAAGCVAKFEPTDRVFKIGGTASAYFKFIRVEEGKTPIHPVIDADASYEELRVMLSLVGDYAGSIFDLMDNPYSASAMSYENCQEKFGDHNPTQTLYRYYSKAGSGEWFYESGPCRYYCFAEQIKSIEITSDKYWSDGYSAGKNLAPLFTVEFDSLAEYVATGFKASYPVKRVREVVSELDPATTALMLEGDYNIYGGTDMTLFCYTIPEDLAMHTITITLYLDSGSSVSYSMKLNDLYL